MNNEISVSSIPVKSLKVRLQFIRVCTSLDTGTLIWLTSKYLLCNTLPKENHGCKWRKQAFYHGSKREVSGHPRGPRGKRDGGYSFSLLPIVFLMTAYLVLHRGSNPLNFLALECKEKDCSVSPLSLCIGGLRG